MSRELLRLAELIREVDRVDGLLSVLADEHCRQVIVYFQESEKQVVSLDGLVNYLLDPDHPPNNRNRLVARLHHVTLPKLAAAGIVEYNTQSHTVKYQDPLGEEISFFLTEWEEDT